MMDPIPATRTVRPQSTTELPGSSPGKNETFAPEMAHDTSHQSSKSQSSARAPTSAEIDAVIAAAMAGAPPAPPVVEHTTHEPSRSATPLMTNLLPAAVGADGRVNLFVGNLPYRVRWQDLKDLFRKAGTVLRSDVSLGPDNRSRGYGTVLMGSREDAARAIDRYNGYTWQTRTLEVRPDRLPPEYEPHMQQQQPQQQMLGHMMAHPRQQGMPPFGQPGFPGGLSGSGLPGWAPNGRGGPMGMGGFGPGYNPSMLSTMSLPGMNPSPHPQPMMMNGSNHLQRSHSPAPPFGPGGLSLYDTSSFQYGASPLAGSLSSGSLPRSLAVAHSNLSTGSAHVSPDTNPTSLSRGPSPASGQRAGAIYSRPASRTDNHSTYLQNEGIHQPQPMRNFEPPAAGGHLPPYPAARGDSVPSEPGSEVTRTTFDEYGAGHPSHVPQHQHPHPSHIQLEGLAHKGAVLGSPSNVHDRVVFVSNLPKEMHWQELKDLFRPAGTIIRADVATEQDGSSRGFGTALFAGEADARRAVSLFNDFEIAGRRLNVHLEKQVTHQEPGVHAHIPNSGPLGLHPLHTNSMESVADGSFDAASQATDHPAPILESQAQAKVASPMGTRVPWHLNLTSTTTPSRPTALNGGDSTPHFRSMHHPGPIAMPPFAPLGDHSLSPSHGRGMPPMTPSMPGFVFNAYPETPPIPHPFLSPGVGLFSPGLPLSSPNGFGSYNPFLNAAPGGPVNRYPHSQGGSAVLGTPTTQTFPYNPIRGQGPLGHDVNAAPGEPVPQRQEGEYFPSTYAYAPALSSSSSPSSSTPASTHGAPRTGAQAPPMLNGRARMASFGPEDGAKIDALTRAAATISLDSQVEHLGNGGANAGNGLSATNSGTSTPTPLSRAAAQGRISLDDKRPNLTVASEWNSDRRASFGDIAKT